MSETKLAYLHGIGSPQLRSREFMMLRHHERKGIDCYAPKIDWESEESFDDLVERVVDEAMNKLDAMAADDVFVFEGSSAGGPLAISALVKVADRRARAITHDSRLRRGELSRYDPRTLERCAHLGTPREARAFYDGVLHCEEVTKTLTPEQMGRIITTEGLADGIVPKSTKSIQGVRAERFWTPTHSGAIGRGMLATPRLIREFPLPEA